MNQVPESGYQNIEGTQVFPSRSGDMVRIINSPKAQTVLAQKGIEIGTTYKLFGPGNEQITIIGISDDMQGFHPNDTQETIQSLRAERATLWGYLGEEKKVANLGYISSMTKKDDPTPGFNMSFYGKIYRYDKVETQSTQDVVEVTHSGVLALL